MTHYVARGQAFHNTCVAFSVFAVNNRPKGAFLKGSLSDKRLSMEIHRIMFVIVMYAVTVGLFSSMFRLA